MEPISIPDNSSLAIFIKIKDVPQIRDSEIKMLQLMNLYFDIEVAKVHKVYF